MTTIPVNGTSIQAAIDAAQAGDTLAVAAGSYAGFRVAKPLSIIGTGAAKVIGSGYTIQITAPSVTLQGLQIGGATVSNQAVVIVTGANAPDAKILNCDIGPGEGYGIRLYQNDRLTVKDTKIHHVAAGVEIHRRGGGSSFTNVDISDVDKMVSDVDAGANGGDAYQFYSTAGPILVKGGTLERLRAKSVYAAGHWNTPVDGGAYNIFGSTSDLTIEDQIIKDAVNFAETGKNPTDGDSYRVVLRRIKFYGNKSTDPYFISSGYFVRSGIDYIVEECEFHEADWFALLLTSGGNFGGTLSGLKFINNKIWLGKDQAYAITVPNSALAQLDGNQVYLGQQSRVAEVRGTFTSSLPQFRTLIGQSAPKEYWGAEVIIPPEPPVDPCADVKAELVATQEQLATSNTQRDTLRDIDQRALAVLNDKRLSQTTRIQRARSILNEASGV